MMSLDFLFKPKSVAVIGASSRPLTIGYRIIKNLQNSGFTGKIYPVNPKEETIADLKAYKTVLDIPENIDLAHIVVRNNMVPDVLAECGVKQVKVVIINSAGFSEIGAEGIELEKRICEIGKESHLRIFGPNCQGIMNSDSEIRAYCNFTFTPLIPGNISILAQSGGIGEVVNQRLYSQGYGIRMYASTGNGCDISIPEILDYWKSDEGTKVIILQIESLVNLQEFLQVVKGLTRVKPVLGMKTGWTKEGSKAVASHTGRLLGEEVPMELIFEEAGIITCRTEDDLCQTAIGFSQQPLPKGNRVAVITNTGGPAIVCVDHCIEQGLVLSEFTPTTKETLKQGLFPWAAVNNPVDVLATAGPEHYELTLKTLLNDETVDSIILNFITPFFVDCESVARTIVKVSSTEASPRQKPILGVIMTDKRQWVETLKIFKGGGIPVYDFPETAPLVLATMLKAKKISEEPSEPPVIFSDVKRAKAQAIIDRGVKEKKDWLTSEECWTLLDCYKIPFAKYKIGKDLRECQNALEEFGYPVVLKIDSPQIIHKSDAGGVFLNIKNEKELTKAYKKLKSQNLKSFLVQEFVPGGKEVIIGSKMIEGLGPVIMFGLGGIFVEVFKDVVFRLAPLTKRKCKAMIEGIKGFPLLSGTRGEKPVDLDKLFEILLRLSTLVSEVKGIKEIDLNPVKVFETGIEPKVVDVRVRI